MLSSQLAKADEEKEPDIVKRMAMRRENSDGGGGSFPMSTIFETWGSVRVGAKAMMTLLQNGEAVLLYPGGAKEVRNQGDRRTAYIGYQAGCLLDNLCPDTLPDGVRDPSSRSNGKSSQPSAMESLLSGRTWVVGGMAVTWHWWRQPRRKLQYRTPMSVRYGCNICPRTWRSPRERYG